jgi:hypothetical protein
MCHGGENTNAASAAAVRNRLRKVYSSDMYKRIVAFPQRLVIFAKQYRNKPVFSVDIRARFGLFAILQLILFILIYCEEHKLFPDIVARGGLYGDPTGRIDWFGCCFERIKRYGPEIEERLVREDRIYRSNVANVQQLGFRRRYEEKLDLTGASRLFSKYYRPSVEIRSEVDAIVKRLSIHRFTLGVHYRGTDKAHEAGRVPWEMFAVAVDKTLANEPRITNILVSSDEPQFLDYIRNRRFASAVAFVPSSHLSVNGRPVHFSGHDGFQIVHEALVTSLLLSRCGFLLKTASYLSAWSKIFNPALKVLLISPPEVRPIWFPDSALWTSQRGEQVEFRSIPAFKWFWQDEERSPLVHSAGDHATSNTAIAGAGFDSVRNTNS